MDIIINSAAKLSMSNSTATTHCCLVDFPSNVRQLCQLVTRQKNGEKFIQSNLYANAFYRFLFHRNSIKDSATMCSPLVRLQFLLCMSNQKQRLAKLCALLRRVGAHLPVGRGFFLLDTPPLNSDTILSDEVFLSMVNMLITLALLQESKQSVCYSDKCGSSNSYWPEIDWQMFVEKTTPHNALQNNALSHHSLAKEISNATLFNRISPTIDPGRLSVSPFDFIQTSILSDRDVKNSFLSCLFQNWRSINVKTKLSFPPINSVTEMKGTQTFIKDDKWSVLSTNCGSVSHQTDVSIDNHIWHDVVSNPSHARAKLSWTPPRYDWRVSSVTLPPSSDSCSLLASCLLRCESLVRRACLTCPPGAAPCRVSAELLSALHTWLQFARAALLSSHVHRHVVDSVLARQSQLVHALLDDVQRSCARNGRVAAMRLLEKLCALLVACCPYAGHMRFCLYLLKRSIEPYFRMLEDLIYRGECGTDERQFPVVKRPQYLLMRNDTFWTHTYRCVTSDSEFSHPTIIRRLASEIYECGRGISLLKVCKPQHVLLQNTSLAPPINLCLSQSALFDLQLSVNKYVQRIESVVPNFSNCYLFDARSRSEKLSQTATESRAKFNQRFDDEKCLQLKAEREKKKALFEGLVRDVHAQQQCRREARLAEIREHRELQQMCATAEIRAEDNLSRVREEMMQKLLSCGDTTRYIAEMTKLKHLGSSFGVFPTLGVDSIADSLREQRQDNADVHSEPSDMQNLNQGTQDSFTQNTISPICSDKVVTNTSGNHSTDLFISQLPRCSSALCLSVFHMQSGASCQLNRMYKSESSLLLPALPMNKDLILSDDSQLVNSEFKENNVNVEVKQDATSNLSQNHTGRSTVDKLHAQSNSQTFNWQTDFENLSAALISHPLGISECSHNDVADDITYATAVNFQSFLLKSVQIPLRVQLRLVNSTILNYIFIDMNFVADLQMIRRFVLLSNGIFSNKLCSDIFYMAKYDMTPMQLLNPCTLRSVLDTALEAAFGRLSGTVTPHSAADHCGELLKLLHRSIQRLSFVISAVPRVIDWKSANVFSCVDIDFCIDWPSSLVVTSHNKTAYRSLFHFLLKLRRAVFTLENTFHELTVCRTKSLYGLSTSRSSAVMRRHLSLCTHELLHVMGSLHSHFCQQVLGVCWTRFWRALGFSQSSAAHNSANHSSKLAPISSLDDLIRAHAQFVDDFTIRCLLEEKHAQFQRMFDTLVEAALEFSSCVTFVSTHTYPHALQQYQLFVQHFHHVRDALFNRLSLLNYESHIRSLCNALNINGYYTHSS